MMEGETILSGAPKDRHVSEFQVLHSGGGYYIGTLWTACRPPQCAVCIEESWPPGFTEPNTRETTYFATTEAAAAALATYAATGIMPYARSSAFNAAGGKVMRAYDLLCACGEPRTFRDISAGTCAGCGASIEARV